MRLNYKGRVLHALSMAVAPQFDCLPPKQTRHVLYHRNIWKVQAIRVLLSLARRIRCVDSDYGGEIEEAEAKQSLVLENYALIARSRSCA